MSRSIIVFLISLALAAFLLDRAGLLTPVRGVAYALLAPVAGFLTKATNSVSETVKIMSDLPSLVRENSALTAENSQLKSELAAKIDIIHENDLLRSELSLPARGQSQEGIAAFIVGRSRTGPFGTFLINRGEKDGLKIGQVALSQGVLVGRISEVFPGTATLIPITNVNSIIPVTLVESRGIGLLKGGVKGLVVEEISRDVGIISSEAVISSELGGVVPPGILVGKVEATAGGAADVFQNATVTSPIPFNWLELVVVLP